MTFVIRNIVNDDGVLYVEPEVTTWHEFTDLDFLPPKDTAILVLKVYDDKETLGYELPCIAIYCVEEGNFITCGDCLFDFEGNPIKETHENLRLTHWCEIPLFDADPGEKMIVW